MPRTTAAYLQLDLAHRTQSPIAPDRWAAVRSISARANRCHYAEVYAMADSARFGTSETKLNGLSQPSFTGWSAVERSALQFARKLSRSPWEHTREDFSTLEADQGPQKAMAIFWWLCRGLYMAQISDGFQLSLEREDAFSLPQYRTRTRGAVQLLSNSSTRRMRRDPCCLSVVRATFETMVIRQVMRLTTLQCSPMSKPGPVNSSGSWSSRRGT